MRFSIRLNNDLPVRDYVRLAQAAEAVGFDQFWVSHDLFLQSAPVILTAIAAATERIALGTCVLNPYTMHPAEIAMTAATLDEYSGGRFLLGLAAGAADFLGWVGIAQETPLGTLRTAVAQIRAVLAGKPVPGWQPEAYLRMPAPPNRHIPIYLGAASPRMLRFVGEIADGALPLMFAPERYPQVAGLIGEGIVQAGRTAADVDLAACLWVSTSPDRAAAEAVLADKVAYYGHAMSPLIWDFLGVSQADFAPIAHALQTARDPAKARALVTPQMLRIGVAGTGADLIARLEPMVTAGAMHLSFGPPLGPDPLAAITELGRTVLPHFREKRRRSWLR